MEDYLEEQRRQWIVEQLEIAAKVKVLPDDPDDGNSEPGRFFAVPLHLSGSTNQEDPEDGSSSKNNDVTYFGGVDVSFPGDEHDDAVAVYVILSYPSMQVVYQDHQYFRLTVPYIPSFLSFREIEPTVALIQQQQSRFPQYTPSAILVDGNGRWHPRRVGFACDLGVRTGLATIGIGKTLFYEGGVTKEMVSRAIVDSLSEAVAVYERSHSNSSVILFDRTIVQPTAVDGNCIDERSKNDECDRVDDGVMQELSSICMGLAIPMSSGDTETPILAYALVGQGGRRTKHSSGAKNPIFISVGHNVSLRNAVLICTQLCTHARIPEPVRQADLRGRELLRQKQNAVVR